MAKVGCAKCLPNQISNEEYGVFTMEVAKYGTQDVSLVNSKEECQRCILGKYGRGQKVEKKKSIWRNVELKIYQRQDIECKLSK